MIGNSKEIEAKIRSAIVGLDETKRSEIFREDIQSRALRKTTSYRERHEKGTLNSAALTKPNDLVLQSYVLELITEGIITPKFHHQSFDKTNPYVAHEKPEPVTVARKQINRLSAGDLITETLLKSGTLDKVKRSR